MTELYSIGSLPFLLMGLLAIVVAIGPLNWCMYGRATLGYVGLFLVLNAGTRFLVAGGFLNLEHALGVTAILGTVFCVIILELLVIHFLNHHSFSLR